MAQKSRADIRRGVHSRIRKKIRGSADRPRLAVYRSLNHIYAQLIDDDSGKTLATASTAEKSFTGTGGNIASLSIRRTGTNDWQALSAAPAAGASSAVAFSNPDCAFDIRASLAGGKTAEWSGVNLCGTSRLTLRQRASGETWVDYD